MRALRRPKFCSLGRTETLSNRAERGVLADISVEIPQFYGVRMFGCETSGGCVLAAALPATPPLQGGDNLHVLGSVPVKIR